MFLRAPGRLDVNAFARAVAVVAVIASIGAACVQTKPATDTGDVGLPTGSTPLTPTSNATPIPSTTPSPGASPTTATAIAYIPDLQGIFNGDCVPCHSNSFASGRYSMSTYSAIMKDVTPGSASSLLVRDTQSNGSMYRYWSGNRAAKAQLVYDWVVKNNAAERR